MVQMGHILIQEAMQLVDLVIVGQAGHVPFREPSSHWNEVPYWLPMDLMPKVAF